MSISYAVFCLKKKSDQLGDLTLGVSDLRGDQLVEPALYGPAALAVPDADEAGYLLHRAAELFFFFNEPATTEISPLSLHDALPISCHQRRMVCPAKAAVS